METGKYTAKRLLWALVLKVAFLTLGLAAPAVAEVYQAWIALYNGPANDVDGAYAIAVDDVGNAYVTGFSRGATRYDFTTIKYSTDGEQLWLARYDGPAHQADIAYDLVLDVSANVYVTGPSRNENGFYECATGKYDTNGNLLWAARYVGPGGGEYISRDIQVDANGNVYISGESVVSGMSADYLTIKYDPLGNQLWEAHYDGPANGDDRATDLFVDGAGNVYVTGQSQGVATDYDFATIKYDTDGNQQWVMRWNGDLNMYDGAVAVRADSDGNVYVAGTGYHRNNGWGLGDYVVIKYDANGNQLWMVYHHDPFGVGSDYLADMEIDSAGNVYVTGECWRYSLHHDDYTTIKYDTNGRRIWLANYSGIGDNDRATALALGADGSVYVTGGSGHNAGGNPDYGTVKYDINGNQLWEARYRVWANTPYDIAVDSTGNAYVTGIVNGDYGTIKYSETPPNQAPTANAGPDVAIQSAQQAATIVHGSATDPDGDALECRWSEGADILLGWTPVLPDGSCPLELSALPRLTRGVHTLTLNVCESGTTEPLTSSDEMVLTVLNTPPVAHAGPDQTVHAEQVSLDGSGSYDWDADYPLTYSWQITSKPAGSQSELDDPTLVNPWFWLDVIGTYEVELVVTDCLGAQSTLDTTIISTHNIPPVADAGSDQQLLELHAVVQLGTETGRQSYDPDGDTITYTWSVAGKPEGSQAELDDPSCATPTFTADVYGTYIISLVVADPWATSEPDTVSLSFENVAPVACTNGNQSRLVDEIVTLDGTSSYDANNDVLAYRWSMVSKPDGSQAEITDATAPQTTFVADLPGTFTVSLVVNDGQYDSDPPATATIYVISHPDAATDELQHTIELVNGIPAGSLKNKQLAKPLTNKINSIIEMIDLGLYGDALDKLIHDIVHKTNGCAVAGQPDKDDWIIACQDQEPVYLSLTRAIILLQSLFQ